MTDATLPSPKPDGPSDGYLALYHRTTKTWGEVKFHIADARRLIEEITAVVRGFELPK
jgi:hypothetical protein